MDRYYIERFLAEHRADITGDVVELLDDGYTRRFGHAVRHSTILDIDPGNPRATLVADLASPAALPEAAFDCFVLTQTLQFIYDVRAAVRSCHRMLRPGGTLLASVPAVSRISRRELETEHWRFTVASCTRLLGDAFGAENVAVRSHGNVLAAIAFLTGMAAEELSPRELDAHDPFFPVVVTARAVRPAR